MKVSSLGLPGKSVLLLSLVVLATGPAAFGEISPVISRLSPSILSPIGTQKIQLKPLWEVSYVPPGYSPDGILSRIERMVPGRMLYLVTSEVRRGRNFEKKAFALRALDPTAPERGILWSREQFEHDLYGPEALRYEVKVLKVAPGTEVVLFCGPRFVRGYDPQGIMLFEERNFSDPIQMLSVRPGSPQNEVVLVTTSGEVTKARIIGPSSLEIAWRITLSVKFSSLAVSRNYVYLFGTINIVRDLSDGQLLGCFAFPGGDGRNEYGALPVVLADGTVLVYGVPKARTDAEGLLSTYCYGVKYEPDGRLPSIRWETKSPFNDKLPNYRLVEAGGQKVILTRPPSAERDEYWHTYLLQANAAGTQSLRYQKGPAGTRITAPVRVEKFTSLAYAQGYLFISGGWERRLRLQAMRLDAGNGSVAMDYWLNFIWDERLASPGLGICATEIRGSTLYLLTRNIKIMAFDIRWP